MAPVVSTDTEPNLEPEHPCSECGVRLLSICGALAGDELRDLRQSGTTIRHKAGATIFFEGEPVDAVFTTTAGTLRLSKLLPDGRRQIAGFIFPGDFLGITMEDEHAFTVEAITDAELCRFPRYHFDTLAEQHPQLERRLYALAAHELAAARQQVVLLGRKTAAERVISFLLMLGRRCAQEDRMAQEIAVPMSRNDIADYLGLRIETVSREFSALKSAGLIQQTNKHTVWLLQPGRLAKLAEG